MQKQKITFILLLIVISFNLNAQNNILGVIKDTNNNRIAFAEIELFNDYDSTILKHVIADSVGCFLFKDIKKGNYKLTITALPFNKKILQVKKDSIDLNIGEIIVADIKSNQLQSVTITSKKQQIEQKIDRLVVNVSGTPIGISGTALEVLQRLPGIDVNTDGNTIALNGKSQVGVLMNGKLIRIPISSLLQILGSTNAKDIDRIELISNPPSKYDAEFTGGLINIIQVKKETDGSNGTILLGLGYGKKDKEKAGINWNIRKNKTKFYGDLNYDRNANPRIFTNTNLITRDTIFSYNTTTNRFPVITNYSGRLGLDYFMNKKVTMGMQINGSLNRFKQNVDGKSYIGENPGKTRAVNLLNDENSRRELFTTNINTGIQIDASQSVNIDVDYLHYYNKAPNNYENTFISSTGSIDSTQIFNATKRTPVNVWVGRLDYSRSLNKKMRLDIGTKYTYSTLKNDVLVQDYLGGSYFKNVNLSENSKLIENIFAIYTSLNWDVNKTTKANLGIRYENSSQNLTLESKGNVLNSPISQFFPTFFLSKNINKKSSLQFSYGRRINRPTYFDLAPFVLFLDPNTFYFGNIKLKPAISNAISVNYKWTKYFATVEFTNEKNTIATSQSVFLDEKKQQILTSLNIDYLNTLSLSFILPFKVSKWWDMQNTIQASYIEQKLNNEVNNDIFYILRTTQNFSLPKDFSIQLFVSYNSKRLSGISTINDFQRTSLSIDKKLKKVNSVIQLSFTDIFGRDYSFNSTNSSNNAYVKYGYEPRVFRLTYMYNFGNSKLERERKRELGSDEIKKRIE